MLSRHKSTVLLLTLLAFSFVCVPQQRGLPLTYKSKPLHQIKKIYVVDMGFGFVKTHDGSGHRVLKEDEADAYLQKE